MRVDGNAAAGMLAEIFGRDVSLAVASCARCGNAAEVARCIAYVSPMGIVLRCAECDDVLAVAVEGRGIRQFTMTGIRSLRVTIAELTDVGGRWQGVGMAIEVRPATVFADVATMVGPKRPDANVCWCLSYRVASKENRELTGTARGERVKKLVRQTPPPGVLAYDGDEVVGLGGRAPAGGHQLRDEPPHPARRRPGCLVGVVHPGATRSPRRGDLARLLEGAVEFARRNGAPAIEGYPVDNGDDKVDLTMAYVGTRRLFEKSGFRKASDTTSVLDGFPRVLMRLDL